MNAESPEVAAVRREMEAESARDRAELSSLGEAVDRRRAEAERAAERKEEQFQALRARVREIAAARGAPRAVETLDFAPEDDEDVPSARSDFEREAHDLASMVRPSGAQPGEPASPAAQEPSDPAELSQRPSARARAPRDLDDEDDLSNQSWMS